MRFAWVSSLKRTVRNCARASRGRGPALASCKTTKCQWTRNSCWTRASLARFGVSGVSAVSTLRLVVIQSTQWLRLVRMGQLLLLRQNSPRLRCNLHLVLQNRFELFLRMRLICISCHLLARQLALDRLRYSRFQEIWAQSDSLS